LPACFAALTIAPAIFADSNTNTLTANAPFPVTITVDAGKVRRRTEAHLAVLRRGRIGLRLHEGRQKLLGELGQLGGPQVYFRAHDLLTSGDGAYALKFSSTSAYKEDANGTPVYDWSINDKFSTPISNAE